jgi:ABC-2 type transport system ATP-binding protein
MGSAARSLFRPKYREVHALQDVNLQINRGEIVAYAGPNGAGKSTTIKLLAGILGPDFGRVVVNGLDPVKDRLRHVAQIGVVFGQRTELWYDLPVRASFEWKRVVWDISRERYHASLEELVDLLGLQDLMPALARELSLGQRMRADLGLALLHEPKLLLLDEPTIGLDVLGKRRILSFVKALQGRSVTVIVTSHDMSDLEQLAERVVMIDRGHIAFDGDFVGLRRRVAAKRYFILEVDDLPPEIVGAERVASSGNRHRYLYLPEETNLSRLLASASQQVNVLDIEIQSQDIDDVVADLYEQWQTKPTAPIKGDYQP